MSTEKRGENIDSRYSSGVEAVDKFEKGEEDSFGEGENLAEKLRPSEETVETGERILGEEMSERLSHLYGKLYDKLEGDEKMQGVGRGVNLEAKASYVKDFFVRNPKRKNELLEENENFRKEYEKIIDLGEIRGCLDPGEMKVETSFLLYDYFRKKYEMVNKEIERDDQKKASNQEGMDAGKREAKEKEKEDVFKALKEMGEKLSAKDITKEVEEGLGSKDDYIEKEKTGSRKKKLEGEGRKELEEEIFQREWEKLSDNRKREYSGINDFKNKQLENIKESFRKIGREAENRDIIALLRKYSFSDIRVETGLFYKRARLGERSLKPYELDEFTEKEKERFKEEIKKRMDEKLGKEWDEEYRKRMESELKKVVKLTEAQVRETCNRIRKEKMDDYWEGQAKKAGKSKEEIKNIREIYKEADGFDLSKILESIGQIEGELTGKLKEDTETIWNELANHIVLPSTGNKEVDKYIKEDLKVSTDSYKKKKEKKPNAVRFVFEILKKMDKFLS